MANLDIGVSLFFAAAPHYRVSHQTRIAMQLVALGCAPLGMMLARSAAHNSKEWRLWQGVLMWQPGGPPHNAYFACNDDHLPGRVRRRQRSVAP